MLLRLPSRSSPLHHLLLTLLKHHRRLALLLLITLLLHLYSTRKHPLTHHPHTITHPSIELELTAPPSSFPDTNGFLPLPTARSLCATHHLPLFRTRHTRRKIYDLVLLNGELDWLEIRLTTMVAHVDYFIILESALTFTGRKKELVFQDNAARFERWAGKIVYKIVENMPEDAARAWEREDYQRDALLTQGLAGLDEQRAPRVGDVLVVADVDEIVRPAALMVLRNCETPLRVTLRSEFYYYGFQWRHRGEQWAHPQATRWEGGDTIRPVDLRNGEGGNVLVRWWERADLWNAGWHCSSCFRTVEEMLNKMASFSHVGLNQEGFRDRARIVERVRGGRDLWDRPGEVYGRVEGNWDLPEPLTRATERERFGYLLDRDGVNGGFEDVESVAVTTD